MVEHNLAKVMLNSLKNQILSSETYPRQVFKKH